MDYQFRDIEKKWQQFWAGDQTFKADNDSVKPKYYVLDMFPYPSGAGLHVGHPLGYIASDIFARYKRLKGFNVLHPMGYDSFGLPAEQYAIQTGQHPAITTETNINRYREQLDNIGFSFDWSREVRTSDPNYYKWTQWIFMQLFNSWYNLETDKAEPIHTLLAKFETQGSNGIKAVSDDDASVFTADEWKQKPEAEQQKELLKYRLTYLRESTVNWCPALGTVLANDEIKDGFSERGGYPVEQKKMMQWSMRITAYADRLLQGLNTIDWPEPLKEMQRNWIGKSVGAIVKFSLTPGPSPKERGAKDKYGYEIADLGGAIEVFTTRVDTIFGATFLVLAPEHELVARLTTPEQKQEIENYIAQTKKKSDLDRMADTKTVSGAFTGSYALNPINGAPIPVWIADYVLAGYGTGAVMAVPSGDQRDWLFANKFGLPVIAITDAQKDLDKQADPTKEGRYINSDLINGLTYKEATNVLIAKLEDLEAGKAKVNYRLRDAIFGRQRYWGEPVPVYFKNGLPYLIDEKHLPLALPEVDKYLPTEDGQPPLGNSKKWAWCVTENKIVENDLIDQVSVFPLELSTMPGWAGSSWYWYRYMDAHNQDAFAGKKAIEYWKDVDLYIGGSEHATGHLLYSRFWNKFLKDLGYVVEEEPFKKLINQGMILGRSNFAYRLTIIDDGESSNYFLSKGQYDKWKQTKDLNDEQELLNEWNIPFKYKNWGEFSNQMITVGDIHVDVNIIENDVLDINKFRASRPEYVNATFIFEDGSISSLSRGDPEGVYICGHEVEKMSKSKFNVVNPDDIIERYGADTLRMYEMFLGPLEQSKPWNTNGIEGVFKFLRKFWKLFHDDEFNFTVSGEEPTKAEYKALHKIIRKAGEDIERFSFNTSVSSFMICVNELTDLKCNKRKILQDLVIVLAPYAPHITEELWMLLGNKKGKLSYANYPVFNPEYLVENEFSYPVSINGKTRMNLTVSLGLEASQVEELVLANDDVKRYLDGKSPKKIIFVKGKIINMVV